MTNGINDYWSAVVFFELKISTPKAILDLDLTVNEKEIFTALKIWRNDLAQKLGSSAFRICYNSHLISIAQLKPKSLDELKKVKVLEKLDLQIMERILFRY